MTLYLLRHGKADPPGWTGPDDKRPLSEEGVEEMRIVASALKRLRVKPSIILSSPLPRALRTAELAAEKLGAPVRQRAELEPGFDQEKCNTLLALEPGADLMLVGHEPDFSGLIRALTGGRVNLSKGAAAALDIFEDPPGARLLWLFPAKALIRLYG